MDSELDPNDPTFKAPEPVDTSPPKRTVTTRIIGTTAYISHHPHPSLSLALADIHPDAIGLLALKGAAAIIAAAKDSDGAKARIDAIKAGRTSTRTPATAKEAPPLVRAIALANAHATAAGGDPKVLPKLPGGKPNPAFDAIHATALAHALTLDAASRKAAGRRKDVMKQLAELIGE